MCETERIRVRIFEDKMGTGLFFGGKDRRKAHKIPQVDLEEISQKQKYDFWAALAKALLPRKIRVSMYPSCPAMDRDEWLRLEDSRTHLDDSIRYHRELIETGGTEDFEVEIQ